MIDPRVLTFQRRYWKEREALELAGVEPDKVEEILTKTELMRRTPKALVSIEVRLRAMRRLQARGIHW